MQPPEEDVAHVFTELRCIIEEIMESAQRQHEIIVEMVDAIEALMQGRPAEE